MKLKFDNKSLIDDSGKRSITTTAESIALANELRYKPDSTKIFIADGKSQKIFVAGRLWGFDCETCTFEKLMSYFTGNKIKRSQSLISFVIRVMTLRFPKEYHENKNRIERLIGKDEYQSIESNKRNEIEWLGECGFQNMVYYTKLKKNVNVIKGKNDTIKITRK